MAAFAATHQPGPARPDVHLHRLPQPGLPGQGRRHHRHHLRRPGRDGHRRRLVRARMAGLRLRFPARPGAAARAGRGRADHAAGLDDGLGNVARARSIRSTGRSSGRCRCSRAASRSGSPAAARRSPCASRRSTRSTPTSTAPRTASGTSREVLAGHCRRLGRDFDAITRSSNYNIAIGRDEKEVADRLAWLRDRYTEDGGRGEGRVAARRLRRHARGRHPGADRGEAVRAEGGRDDLRHHLLPRTGLRHLGSGAVRAGGHPGLRTDR